MSKPASLVAACALTLAASAGAAFADGNSEFSASNTALLRGYTASPGRLYVPTTGDEARLVTGSVGTSARSPVLRQEKAPDRVPVR
ncbi:hypothetical protein MMSR116_01045 [Methylobacterium mesophilicum SR1.6/6]|uniref:Uncharacterized protein n=1 Tax=Methylobacterium mesophilicum SR1.6/6 TaxID=908290 RepID=A0A6B9FDL0_9HYPH|nr:hypothetical protein [Methylobacterium mesophilicum]QGY00649.1 hypothetical protein MMSR116_01045 [Methylobacterium mesophilicum SR1.6/6]